MNRNLIGASLLWVACLMALVISACSSGSGKQTTVDAADVASSGTLPQASGGRLGSGGVVATGGVLGSGGGVVTGGEVATGGVVAVGGTKAGGGTLSTGGTGPSGGTVGSGGTRSGGTSAKGGTFATGGTAGTGGTIGTGGIHGDAGIPTTGGSKADAASTLGCQCTLDGAWSVSWDCYCAYYGCSDNFASYRAYLADAGDYMYYVWIREYAGCDRAIVFRDNERETSYRYFEISTGRFIGVAVTSNYGISCPFGADAGSRVWTMTAGQHSITTGCAETACFARSNVTHYCSTQL